MQSRVFVLNDSGHDISDLSRFGDMEIFSEGLIPKFQLTRMFRNFIPLVAKSKATDYVAAIGPTIMLVIFCCMMAVEHGKLNLLLMQNGKYVVRTLVFRKLGGS